MRRAFLVLTSRSFTPWLLLLLTIISFGMTIPLLSYFMDDWYLIWFKHAFGALQYPAYFALDRPLMGYFYVVANALLFNSESPWVWHIFGLLIRWVCTLALWQFLNTLWPKNLKQNTWVALLAAIFPGFNQHWIIVVYSFFYTCLAALFFSFTLMIRALRSRKLFWVNYILSILIGFYAYAAAEFYFGLELIRPLIIWFVMADFFPLRRQRFWKTLKLWSPYLVVFIGFGIWRTFFFESMNHAVTLTNQFSTSLGRVIIKGLSKVIQAVVDSVVTVWTQILNLSNYPSWGSTAIFILSVAIIVFLVLFWWLHSMDKSGLRPDENSADVWSRQSFWLGALSLVVAILPFWAADLEVSPAYPYDRFLLAYLFGSCLLVAGLINQFARNRTLQIAFLSVLVAAGAAFQVNLSLHYVSLTEYQKELIWQLAWRAPDLQPCTTVVAPSLPDQDYLSGNALAAQINWLYSSKQVDYNRAMAYFFVLLGSPLENEVEGFSPNQVIDYDFRSYKFIGRTNQVLVISDNAIGCLRVLDAQLTPAQSVVGFPSESLLKAANISNLETINISEPQKTPPAHLFGDEPAHTWCYYFEKADLARQQGDYTKSYDLVKEANSQFFYPMDLTEWYPFIDSALHLGLLDEAAELSSRIISDGYLVHNGVCNTWQNYLESIQGDAEVSEKTLAQFSKMGCN